jgi:hypothetical protein
MSIQRPKMKKRGFQKKVAQIFVDKEQQQEQENFTIISINESFFFYDSLVRRVWIDKKRPVVRVTGSHQNSLFLVP